MSVSLLHGQAIPFMARPSRTQHLASEARGLSRPVCSDFAAGCISVSTDMSFDTPHTHTIVPNNDDISAQNSLKLKAQKVSQEIA